MRAIVTGGAGFIGSTIVDALQEQEIAVLIVDDLSRGRIENLEVALARGAQLAEIDIRDQATVRTTFVDFRPDLVFHLAAQIDVRASMDDPALDAGVNVVGSVNVLLASAASGARRVINTSTGGAIYGETDVVPTPESVAPAPMSAYGTSKYCAERYARWFQEANGLDTVTLRYGNVYGPRQDPRGDAGVISIFADRLLGGDKPTIFGDGTQTRDYVFVRDIAAANLAAATADRLPRRVYNVGSGREVSVLELITELTAAAGLEPDSVRPEFAPSRAGEVSRSCLDVSAARVDLGLPDPVPLRDGLRSTLDWVRELRA